MAMAGLLQIQSQLSRAPAPAPAVSPHPLSSPSSSSSSSSWRRSATTAPIFSTPTKLKGNNKRPYPFLHPSLLHPWTIRSSSSSAKKTTTTTLALTLTYLEINSWMWELPCPGPGGLRILVDPILVGNLDFGVPWLFDAAKKHTQSLAVDDFLGAVDLLLISQSLDDHCHVRTLKQLSARAPQLPVVATPNARPIIAALPFRDVTYLEPGQSTAVAGQRATILATAGPVLGPPWQRPENGYLVTCGGGGARLKLYYEPHCVYDRSFLEGRGVRADVVVTPVVKQLLPGNFTLVSGQEDAVELATLLGARCVVPMSNGEFDARGLLTAVLSTQGTTEAFKARVLEPTPGEPLQLELELEPEPEALPSPSAATTT